MPEPRQPNPWWDRDGHADRRPFLLARGRIQGAVRAWFGAQGFVEVEAGALQVSPGNETHLHALATEIVAPESGALLTKPPPSGTQVKANAPQPVYCSCLRAVRAPAGIDRSSAANACITRAVELASVADPSV